MATIDSTSFSRKVSRGVLGLDLHSWELVMVLSLGFAALAAFAVVASTAAVVKLQKQATEATKLEFDRYRLEAGENIAAANAAGEAAKADAEKAHAEAAKANERTAELKLALEREIAARQPRAISPEQGAALERILANVHKGPVFIVADWVNPEAKLFAKQIEIVLAKIGFPTSELKTADKPLSFGKLGAFLVIQDKTRQPAFRATISRIQGYRVRF